MVSLDEETSTLNLGKGGEGREGEGKTKTIVKKEAKCTKTYVVLTDITVTCHTYQVLHLSILVEPVSYSFPSK